MRAWDDRSDYKCACLPGVLVARLLHNAHVEGHDVAICLGNHDRLMAAVNDVVSPCVLVGYGGEARPTLARGRCAGG